jgi:kynurenine 3-monooxygenase
MVTFRADIGYAAALKRDRWQTKVVEGLGTVGLGLGAGLAGWAGLVLLRRYRA